MAKTTWETLNELREYVLTFDLNRYDTFKIIGNFRFYRADEYVSIDETIDEKTTNWSLHLSSVGNSVNIVDAMAQTYDASLENFNKKWEQISTAPAFSRRVRKALKTLDDELKMDEVAQKVLKIEALKAQIAELER